MLSSRKPTHDHHATDTAAADFCRIFGKEMDRLYLLSLLLTADPQPAEECFVRGLEDAMKSNRVFKEWVQAWARRMIIQNAIQMIQPTNAEEGGASADQSRNDGAATPAGIAAITALPAFERFVFVLSVLERYSDQDCSLLLGSTRAQVIAARSRALQHIAESADLQRQLSLASDRRARQPERDSELRYKPLLQLAASV
jgi:DNA-directed RNA polymerase specialized sigma24 family protein